MKKINLLLIIIISTVAIQSCERDDICAAGTPTTPQIIFRFFDNTNRDDLRTVNDLMIFGLDDNNERVDLIGRTVVDTDSITLPLRTDIEQTRFLFIVDFNAEMMTGNIDTLTVSNEREDVFISRACGFANNFNNIQINVEPGDDDFWILGSAILRENVEDETSAHVQIFH